MNVQTFKAMDLSAIEEKIQKFLDSIHVKNVASLSHSSVYADHELWHFAILIYEETL